MVRTAADWPSTHYITPNQRALDSPHPYPGGFKLARPLSIDESRYVRRGSLGAAMMGPFHLSVGSSTGYQSSTTNALTLGGDSGSNLTRMRPLLGQSAPSLSASLVSSKENWSLQISIVIFIGDAILVLINSDSTFANMFTSKVGVIFNLIVWVKLNVRIRIPQLLKACSHIHVPW